MGLIIFKLQIILAVLILTTEAQEVLNSDGTRQYGGSNQNLPINDPNRSENDIPLNPNEDSSSSNTFGNRDRFGNRDNTFTNPSFGGRDQPFSNQDNRGSTIFDRNRFSSNTNRYNRPGGGGVSYPRNPLYGSDNHLNQESTYFIVASRMVRPGQVYRVSVSVNNLRQDLTIRASISRDGVEMSHDSKDVHNGLHEKLLMRIPTTSVPGDYKLRVEGLYNSISGGIAFVNETKLTFSQRSMTVFIQTDKPVYMQGETIRFRVIPITTELKGYDSAIDVYMIDPQGHILRRWLSRYSNLGTVSLDYKLSDQPLYGDWRVRAVVQGQVEEHVFTVEEYYQTRFEVNVTMPAFFFTTDGYLHGKVMANFTSGAPVRGNLTLKATIRPIGYFNTKNINEYFRKGYIEKQEEYEGADIFGPRRYEQGYDGVYNRPAYNPAVDTNNINDPRYTGGPGGTTYNDPYSIEKHFNFDEDWPFWIDKPEYNDYNLWGERYANRGLPYLRFFNGTYEFKYPMRELQDLVSNIAGSEVLITARVGEHFYNEIIEGYAMARIYNSSIKASFAGGSPQVIKPAMPFTAYLVAEYHDGSPLPLETLFYSTVQVSFS